MTDAEVAQVSSPPAVSDRERAVQDLRAALAHLSGELRSLVSLHYLEGMPLRELAEVFGVPEGTIKSRLHRARQILKTTLERSSQ